MAKMVSDGNISEDTKASVALALQQGADTVMAIMEKTKLSQTSVYIALRFVGEVTGSRKSSKGPGRPENTYSLKAGK